MVQSAPVRTKINTKVTQPSVVIAGLLSSLPLLTSAMLAFGIFRIIGSGQPLGERVDLVL